jgi:DNA-binding protein H-NS
LFTSLNKEKQMATYKELKAQAEALMKQAEAARQAEIAAVVAEIPPRVNPGRGVAARPGGWRKKWPRAAPRKHF